MVGNLPGIKVFNMFRVRLPQSVLYFFKQASVRPQELSHEGNHDGLKSNAKKDAGENEGLYFPLAFSDEIIKKESDTNQASCTGKNSAYCEEKLKRFVDNKNLNDSNRGPKNIGLDALDKPR
jgi:hypothetical protein